MIRVSPMTREEAKAVCEWHYEPPYNVYNFSDWQTVIDHEWDLAIDSIREKHFVTLYENNEWIGFGRLSPFDTKVDIGIGLRPDLCGQGKGQLSMLALITESKVRYPDKVPSLMVRSFNERAIKSYESCGFKATGDIDWPVKDEGKVHFVQMTMNENALLPKIYGLAYCASRINKVLAVGISGGFGAFGIKSNPSDMDLFLYCSEILSDLERNSVFEHYAEMYPDSVKQVRLNATCNAFFGSADQCHLNGIDTWLMYFDKEVTLNEVELFANGQYPERLENYFYSTGRLEMFVHMGILFDKQAFLSELKLRLQQYPQALYDSLVDCHLNSLFDFEDLQRAVLKQDVLFYHFALDLSIDHFLQLLFALNRCYFPSRKRSLEYLEKFKIQPENCGNRLLECIQLGSNPNTLRDSFNVFTALAIDLNDMYYKNHL